MNVRLLVLLLILFIFTVASRYTTNVLFGFESPSVRLLEELGERARKTWRVYPERIYEKRVNSEQINQLLRKTWWQFTKEMNENETNNDNCNSTSNVETARGNEEGEGVNFGEKLSDDMLNVFCDRAQSVCPREIGGFIAIQFVMMEPDFCRNLIKNCQEALQILYDRDREHYVVIHLNWDKGCPGVTVYDPLFNQNTVKSVDQLENACTVPLFEQLRSLFGHIDFGKNVNWIPANFQMDIDPQEDNWSCGYRAIGTIVDILTGKDPRKSIYDIRAIYNFFHFVNGTKKPAWTDFERAQIRTTREMNGMQMYVLNVTEEMIDERRKERKRNENNNNNDSEPNRNHGLVPHHIPPVQSPMGERSSPSSSPRAFSRSPSPVSRSSTPSRASSSTTLSHSSTTSRSSNKRAPAGAEEEHRASLMERICASFGNVSFSLRDANEIEAFYEAREGQEQVYSSIPLHSSDQLMSFPCHIPVDPSFSFEYNSSEEEYESDTDAEIESYSIPQMFPMGGFPREIIVAERGERNGEEIVRNEERDADSEEKE